MSSAAVILKFVVVGASVGGLSTAFLLRQYGHEVTVVEKRPHGVENSEHDGALRVPPNMARLMKMFPGATELLKEKGTLCSSMAFSSGETMELLGEMIFSQEITSDLGSDMYLISYNVLVSYLYSICREAGVHIKHDFAVQEVHVEEATSSVVSDHGLRIHGDIIIGADGKKSVVRNIVDSEESESEDEDDFIEIVQGGSKPGRPTNRRARAAYTYTIPISEVQKDPELLPLTQDGRWMIWCGQGCFLATANHGPVFAVGITRAASSKDKADKPWDDLSPLSVIEDQFKVFDRRLQKLIELGKSVGRLTSQSIQPINDRTRATDASSSVILIGDAAHSVPINGPFNTSCAIEHAFTLGRLFSRIKSKSQVPFLLNGYNNLRLPRTQLLENMEHTSLHVVDMPPGPARDDRDAFFRMTLTHEGDGDCEAIASLWTDYVEAYDYDAFDAVDEWWLNWGKPLENQH